MSKETDGQDGGMGADRAAGRDAGNGTSQTGRGDAVPSGSQPAQPPSPEMPARRIPRTAAARFGQRVAARRSERGWSMRELCARAGLPAAPSVIKRLEDTGGVSLDIAARVARALGVSLDGLTEPCAACGDSPPAGFTCRACGADGPERTS